MCAQYKKNRVWEETQFRNMHHMQKCGCACCMKQGELKPSKLSTIQTIGLSLWYEIISGLSFDNLVFVESIMRLSLWLEVHEYDMNVEKMCMLIIYAT